MEVLKHERDRDAQPMVLFGVFDGHGLEGSVVAALAAEQLPRIVQELHPQVRAQSQSHENHRVRGAGTA